MLSSLPPLAAGALALLAFTSNAAAQDPGSFRAGPAHTGVYPGPAVTAYGGLRWRVQTDGPVRSSPIAAEGTVYVGSNDGSLYAIDLATGRVRWTFTAGAPINSTPAVAGSLVIVQSRAGVIVAVERATGRARWRYATGAAAPLAWGHESGDFYTSSPAIAGTTAYVGSRDGRLYALDAATGRLRWRYDTGAQVWSSPAVGRALVVVGDQHGRVHALAAATGAVRWIAELEAHSFTSEGFGFDRTTVQSSPALAGGAVYVGARDGFLYALDRATGARRWRSNHEVSWVNGSPALARGLVFASSSDGQFVQAVDTATGVERWRAKDKGLMWSSPSVAGDIVCVGAADGFVRGFDITTGTEQWRFRTDDAVYSTPLPVAGVVVVGSDDGAVYAIRGAAQPLHRAVFWDSAYATRSWMPLHEAVRKHLAARDYEVLDAAALAEFLGARIADHEPSVVVFAMDHLPESVAPTASDTVLFRRYLDTGGKAVWIGVPPMVWPRRTDGVDFDDLDRDAGQRLLGVDFGPGNFDHYGARPTPAGRRWGLAGWWLARWGAAPGSVSEVLAYDDQGNASSWVKRYGGAPGTGFVRLFGGRNGRADDTGRAVDLRALRIAAEYFPDQPMTTE